MKKLFLSLLFFFFFSSVASAAGISISADKTEFSTDDVVEVRVLVNGQADNGQIGIEGLENFEITGQRSSQQARMVNGQVSALHEKIITLRPKKTGEAIITAMIKENGKEIRSRSIVFKIKKSFIQSAREELLQNSSSSEDILEDIEDINESDTDASAGTLNDLLTAPGNTEEYDYSGRLDIPKLNTFPKVEHLSLFNAVFWLELTGILVGFIATLYGAMFIIRKIKN